MEDNGKTFPTVNAAKVEKNKPNEL